MASVSFKDWLRDNTSLLEGSINLYVRTINRYLKIYDNKVSLENINQFISKSFRESQSPHVKYSFKYYLEFVKKPNLYYKIIKVRTLPRKKMGVYLQEGMIKTIIGNMRDEKYRDIALLQFATGKRAREIITMKEEKIDFDYDENVIKVIVEKKGGREDVAFLSKEYTVILKKYIIGKAGYLFIPRNLVLEDSSEKEKKFNNYRTYYYKVLHKAAIEAGVEKFGTHDFRRNVAEIIKKNTKDIRLVQKLLGHASITTTMRYFQDHDEDVQDAIIKHQKG